MSKLKNTFGLPDSLIDVVTQVNETSHLSLKQRKIAKLAGDPEKIDAEDLAKLRMKNESSAQFSRDMTDANKAEAEKLKSEKVLRDTRKATAPKQPTTVLKMGDEVLDETSDQKKLKWAMQVQANPQKSNLKRDEKVANIVDLLNKKAKPPETLKNSYEEDNELVEVSGTYAFKANDIAPVLIMLKSVLNFLSTSPALRKIMKEETGVDETNVESLINFIEIFNEELDLVEYRTKGAVGKKKQATMSTTSSAPKKSEDDEEEDEGPAYEPASGKDQEHIMTQLKGAMDDERGGRHIDTASGKKYVTKSTASKIHSHLMGLKAPERAQSSSDLYNLKATHPMTKHIQDDHREATQRGIKAPTEKKGRGRPKKAVD